MEFRLFKEQGVSLSGGIVRDIIEQSLRQVFGNIGGAISFEVLQVRQDISQAFLKVGKRCDLPCNFAIDYFARTHHLNEY